ncbi:hypothetical protein BC793_103548 [Actinoplanes xinjiangensis]|uniref:Fibronectin type-III domain-containing protein n=2 Tax=Actinoplanes xinjiangensis TaxID=512350 RepID=A0A316FSQ0_9ACTN|nr:hypothetical protein BC793_103548 [Actinoplanes xinjiangensis]
MTVVAGAAVVIVAGSGLAAWASWSVGAANGRAALQGETLPVVGKPEAVLTSGGVPKISWVGVRFPSGAAVGGYAVTRRVGTAQDEVCRVGAATLTCTDTAAVPGSPVTYTVRAVAGDRWAGVASPKSDELTIPGATAPGPAGLVAKGSVAKVEEKGRRVVPDGDGERVDGAVTPTTNPEPGPTSSAPSATVAPASASPSSSAADGGEGGGG